VTVLTPIPEAPPKPDKPVELDETGKELMRAAKLLRERGHCQFVAEDHEGRVCLAGAIILASGRQFHLLDGGLPDFVPALDRPSYKRLTRSLGRSPWSWNDDRGRTAEEVIEALERAAYQC
jgi:hypothetical protein